MHLTSLSHLRVASCEIAVLLWRLPTLMETQHLSPSLFFHLLGYFPLSAFCDQGSMTAGSQRTVRMSQSRLLSSLYTNDRDARCLWRAPYHNGRLTSDDTSCATTRFLSWGIGVSWMVITDSLSDLCYNWNKTRIASKTVLPRLKPLPVHRSIIWRRRQFSLRVGLLTKAVKAQFHPDDTAHLTCSYQHAWLNKV